MRNLCLFLVFLFLFSCKNEEEQIVFEFPKDTKMKFEEFNEGMEEYSSYIMYIGNPTEKISVKYYRPNFLPPPPPPPNMKETIEELDKKIAQQQDSVKQAQVQFFHKEDLKFTRLSNIDFKNFSNKTLKITVKSDTIPLYRQNNWENRLKTYKAFPVILKNVSREKIEIPVEISSLPLYFKNDKKQWQNIRNSNYMIGSCFPPPYLECVELQPNQIIVYAIPYFKKGENHEVRVGFFDAHSEPFKLSIDSGIIKNQRDSRIDEAE